MRSRWLGLCLAILSAGARAATIQAAVEFPSPAVPPMTAYVYDVDGTRLRSAAVPRGHANVAIEVPPGRYLVFLAPSDPGAPAVYGAHTRYSVCSRRAAPSAECEDHGLEPVTVVARAQRLAVDVDDWYLSGEVVERLDRIRGLASTAAGEPLWLPRFSEYPASPADARARPAAAPAYPGLPAQQRAELRRAAAAGPNFAGDLNVVIARCGADCARILILDARSGTVAEPAIVGEIRGGTSCRGADAIAFRRDSRLLSVTSSEGSQVSTRYFVWDPDGATLVRKTEYRRGVGGACVPAAP